MLVPLYTLITGAFISIQGSFHGNLGQFIDACLIDVRNSHRAHLFFSSDIGSKVSCSEL